METKEKKSTRVRGNYLNGRVGAVIMYIDMNSFFASCEQQEFPELAGKPIGVVTHNSPTACVIAPSSEAKRFGVKTGMRLFECKKLCPHIIPVASRPFIYRKYHVQIMGILKKHCDEKNVMAKSIDEAVMDFTSYKLVYKDFKEIARKIKADIKELCGEQIKCSIGIAPNSFLAKLGTEIQKPDGLIEITPENIDGYLATMKLTDLPGIARSNERRLMMIGIKDPLQMRHSSDALLRKAFGGVVGNYWHARLNFKEVDFYKNDYRAMSATRTVSQKQRESKQTLESLLISLSTRLEQRMVKQKVFCKDVSFFLRYKDKTGWDTHVRFMQPIQDATDIRKYIMERMHDFEQKHNVKDMFANQVVQMGVAIASFIESKYVTYNLFENRMREDKIRLTMYEIKDKYGKNKVRKASETVEPHVMADAIGFGSVKDLDLDGNFNQYLLEEDN